jgi:hypothetical protein
MNEEQVASVHNQLAAVVDSGEMRGVLSPLADNHSRTVRPRRFSQSEMKRVQVEIVNPYCVILRCAQCGSAWSPRAAIVAALFLEKII